MVKFTKKEQAWLERLEKTLAAAPKSLSKKVCSYTIGDNDITLYDSKKVDDYIAEKGDQRDRCVDVDRADAEITRFVFPFTVESTAG